MAHINVKAPSVPSGKRTVLECGDFNRGVSFCRYDRELYKGQSPYIKNMIYDKNILRTRFGSKSFETTQVPSGEIHSVCREVFFGWYVFHIGSSLFAFNGEELRCISTEMPDCASFVFEMNSMLYFFCSDVRIFTVDKELVCSEHIIADTKLMVDAKYNLSSFTALEVEDNMIMYRVSADYLAKETGVSVYKLPCECDPDCPVIIKSLVTGKNIDVEYTVDGADLTLGRDLSGAYNISFIPAKGTQYRNFDKIFGCTETCTYGGNSTGGTRVFFTGNAEYPGYYFHSELLDPLTVRTLSYDILGNGSMNICRLAKQKSDLIAFCDRSIYKISYSFDSNTGPDFTVSEISTAIGCDIPGSVQLIDNRLVFADSHSGIHIIVSSEYTDELSVRRISANINGYREWMGFMNTDLSGGPCVSVDFDRKYMLVCPSGEAYVWDYGNSPYIAGSDPLTSEKSLCWYYFDQLYENTLFDISGKLFGTRSVDGKVDFVCFSEDLDTDFGNSIQCVYISREYDLGKSFLKKVPCEMYINAFGGEYACATVRVFFDGMSDAEENFYFTEGVGEQIKRLYMKLPGHEAYRMSFSFESNGGMTGLYDAAIMFRSEGICYR